MMKRKISILTLAFLFFAATTGLPVTLHFCKMMESVTLEACEMHEVIEIKTSCCDSGIADYPVNLTAENPVCCQSEFIYNKVEDEFLSYKPNENFFPSFKNLSLSTIIIPSVIDFSLQESFFNDSSPPFLINPDLYILNSVLLI